MRRSIQSILTLARDERGIELVEMLAFTPLVFMVMLIAWQFILIGYTGLVAAAAARAGARAAVVLEDVNQAVSAASPDFDGRRSLSVSGGCSPYAGQPVTVRVELETPHVTFPFLGPLKVYPKVTGTATMRCEPPFDAP